MKVAIKHRKTGDVLFEYTTPGSKHVSALDVLSFAIKCGADLRGADLSNVNFEQEKQPDSFLFRADLSGADFSGSNLQGMSFSDVDLNGATFRKTLLRGAVFAGVNLQNANMSYADASKSAFFNCNLTGANMIATDLFEARVESSVLDEANMSRAGLLETRFQYCRLRGTNMEDVYFSGGKFTNSNFSGAKLSSALLDGVGLNGTCLLGAVLENTNKLVGNRPMIKIEHIGPNFENVLGFVTDRGLYLKVGDFLGNEESFKTMVAEKHGADKYGKMYMAALQLARTHAEIWAPN